MGYELYITRKQNWFEENPKISPTEWRAVVAAESDMQMSGYAAAVFPSGETLRYTSPDMAEWKAHPNNLQVWLDFQNGDIVVNNPDKFIIAKMQVLAKKLNALVQGDEGEFYD